MQTRNSKQPSLELAEIASAMMRWRHCCSSAVNLRRLPSSLFVPSRVCSWRAGRGGLCESMRTAHVSCPICFAFLSSRRLGVWIHSGSEGML